jgi:hypothetical protein
MPTAFAGRPARRCGLQSGDTRGRTVWTGTAAGGGCMLLCLNQVFGSNTPSHLSFKGSIVGIQGYNIADINTYPDHPSYQMHG